MTPLNVLISLHRGYGLGDAVQMSAVLRHVAKYRPHWRVDFQAESGRYCIGGGIVANTKPDYTGQWMVYEGKGKDARDGNWDNWKQLQF